MKIMYQDCFRVLSERYVTTEIVCLSWNPKYDLLALSTKRGDVILQRLFWKKAWQLPPKSDSANDGGCSGETLTVTALCWAPNGKHLCVVYSNGALSFVEIESGRVVYQIDGRKNTEENPANSDAAERIVVRWTEFSAATISHPNDEFRLFSATKDDHLFFSLLSSEKSSKSSANSGVYSVADDFLRRSCTAGGADSTDADRLSLLVVSEANAILRLYLNGYFCMAKIDVADAFLKSKIPDGNSAKNTEKTESPVRVVAADVSASLDLLGVAVYSPPSALHFGVFKSPVERNSHTYWCRVAERVAHLTEALSYAEAVLQKVLDCWEDATADLDTKLTSFALQKNADSQETIGDDFLQMLVFGCTSPDFEHFLTHDLAEKGLKKYNASLENSYHTLSNLVGVNMDSAITALYHHITVLRDLMPDDDPSWDDAAKAVGSMSMLVTEIQNAAMKNTRSLHLFIRWLHRCLLTVSDENLPPHLSNFSDDDADVLAEYIREKFTKKCVDGGGAAQLNLDNIGKYLKRDDPEKSTSFCDGPESDFLKKSPSFLECADLHRFDTNAPLAECMRVVRRSIEKVESRVAETFSERSTLAGQFHCLSKTFEMEEKSDCANTVCLSYDKQKDVFRICYATKGDSGIGDEFYIAEFSASTRQINAKWKLTAGDCGVLSCQIINVQSYTTTRTTALVRLAKNETVAVNATDDSDMNYYLFQIDGSTLVTASSSPAKSGAGQSHCGRIPAEAVKFQALSDGQYQRIAVSAPRKVGCILYSCRTRLKLLEMEPEHDETTRNTSDGSNIDME